MKRGLILNYITDYIFCQDMRRSFRNFTIIALTLFITLSPIFSVQNTFATSTSTNSSSTKTDSIGTKNTSTLYYESDDFDYYLTKTNDGTSSMHVKETIVAVFQKPMLTTASPSLFHILIKQEKTVLLRQIKSTSPLLATVCQKKSLTH